MSVVEQPVEDGLEAIPLSRIDIQWLRCFPVFVVSRNEAAKVPDESSRIGAGTARPGNCGRSSTAPRKSAGPSPTASSSGSGGRSSTRRSASTSSATGWTPSGSLDRGPASTARCARIRLWADVLRGRPRWDREEDPARRHSEERNRHTGPSAGSRWEQVPTGRGRLYFLVAREGRVVVGR